MTIYVLCTCRWQKQYRRNDIFSLGSLNDIAEKLISDGRDSIEWLTEDMDEDEINEEYGEDIEEYFCK